MLDFLDSWVNTEILLTIGVCTLFFVFIISVLAKTAWGSWRHKHKHSCKVFDDMGKERDED